MRLTEEVNEMAKIYESTKKAKKKWEAENYDAIGLRVKKGERDRIKAFAEEHGQSLNGFCKKAIYSAMGETAEADD